MCKRCKNNGVNISSGIFSRHWKLLHLNENKFGSFALLQVDDDRVLVFLCKRQDKSWYPEVQNGLETAEEDE